MNSPNVLEILLRVIYIAFMDFCSPLKEREMPIVKRVFNLKSIYACLVLWELKAGLVQADDPAATVMISHYCFLCNWYFESSKLGTISEIDHVHMMYIYGSVSAGREKWPFRVIFFLKVERSCG